MTCERCGLTDCEERAASPLLYEQQKHREKLEKALQELFERFSATPIPK